MNGEENAYRVLAGIPTGEWMLEIPQCRCRWQNNITVDLKDQNDVDWIYLAGAMKFLN